MCLFRPFSGELTKTDVYLIRRIDGEAFGATRASWTVGMLQPLENGPDAGPLSGRVASYGMLKPIGAALERARCRRSVREGGALMAQFIPPIDPETMEFGSEADLARAMQKQLGAGLSRHALAALGVSGARRY